MTDTPPRKENKVTAITLKGGLNVPGTFEVHDREGHVYGTYTSAYFKVAEAHVDLLNREDPEGGYTWTRISEQPEVPSARPVAEAE